MMIISSRLLSLNMLSPKLLTSSSTCFTSFINYNTSMVFFFSSCVFINMKLKCNYLVKFIFVSLQFFPNSFVTSLQQTNHVTVSCDLNHVTCTM